MQGFYRHRFDLGKRHAVCRGSNLRDFLKLLKGGEHKAQVSGVQTKVLEAC